MFLHTYLYSFLPSGLSRISDQVFIKLQLYEVHVSMSLNDQILPLLICVASLFVKKRYPPLRVGRDTQGLRTRIFLLACYEQHITHIMQGGFEP